MELIFLGTGAGVPSNNRNVSSLVLDLKSLQRGLWMFDCGEGTQHQILKSPVKIPKLEKIFITHLHGDHIFGLPGLLCSRSMGGCEDPLTLFGPQGLAQFVETALTLSGSYLTFPLEIIEIDEEGVIYDDGQLKVSAYSLEHPVISYGYRIEEHDKPGALERITEDGRTVKMAYTPLPGWNWTIVGEVDKSVLLSSVTTLRDRFLLAGVVLSVLFAGLFVMIIRRMLTQPLRNVIHLARQYAAGDLRSSLPVTRQDEVGQLVDAINGIGGGLQKMVLQVREAAGEIHMGTNALASDTGESSEQINKQASSVEETSASMEQLAATVQQNAANMEQTQQLVSETSLAVHQGGETVTHAVATMDDIREASKRIEDITRVIESIAFQTNILALNAAVEAARAGEQGRGFAVVADEVRALSSRTQLSTNSISQSVDKMFSMLNAWAKEMEQSRQHAEQCANDIQTSAENVNTIYQEVSEIHTFAQQNAVAADQQRQVVHEITNNIHFITQSSSENLAATHQIGDAANHLKHSAEKALGLRRAFG